MLHSGTIETALVMLLILNLFPLTSLPSPVVFSKSVHVSPCTIQFEFKVDIESRIPTELSPTSLDEITIRCLPKVGVSSLQHELFMPQNVMFLTPIGDSQTIYLGNFLGEINYHMLLRNASVLVTISIEGNATVSPSSVLLDSSETEVVSVSHVGSPSSRENITIRMSFQYLGSLTILQTGQYGIKIDETTEELQLEGDSVLCGTIEIVSSIPSFGIKDFFIVSILFVGILLFAYAWYRVAERGKRKSTKSFGVLQKAQLNTRILTK